MFAKQGLTVFVCLTERSVLTQVTIDDKIIETLSSNWTTSENKTIHTPPPPIHLRTECWLFPTGSKQQHNIAWKEWGRESIIFPFQQNIRNGEVSQLILFLIVGSLMAVYSFSKLGWLCKLTWPVSSENRSVRGRETYFWFMDNLMLPSFKLSESAAKEDEICYDNRYNTLYIELNLKMQITAFPMKLQNSFSLLAGQLVRFQVLNSLGGGLFWLYFPLVFYNV